MRSSTVGQPRKAPYPDPHPWRLYALLAWLAVGVLLDAGWGLLKALGVARYLGWW
jgi:hypothetical protein